MRAALTACASTSPSSSPDSRPGQPGRLSAVPLDAADIPSYLIRRGRTGVTAQEALTRLWPVYGVELADLPAVSVVEIGFGMGEATALLAVQDPQVLAIEVHPAGIASLLRRLEAAALTNVHVYEGNAVPVLQALPATSLTELRLFFPDPWPKARHAKRRIIRPAFAALVASRLAPGGFLHLATDWPAYADHARSVLADWDVVEDRRGRPETGYERRAHRDGRTALDLICTPPAR